MDHALRGRGVAAGESSRRDQLAARGDLVAGQRQLADPAVEHAIPEQAACARLAERAADLAAEDLGEARQPADRGGQRALDLGAQLAGQRRRRAAGRDGDGDRPAIDDRRHDEAREGGTVDHVHRHAMRLGKLRDARLQRLVTGRDDDQRYARQVGLVEGPAGPADAGVGDMLGDLAGDGIGNQRHLRARRQRSSTLRAA